MEPVVYSPEGRKIKIISILLQRPLDFLPLQFQAHEKSIQLLKTFRPKTKKMRRLNKSNLSEGKQENSNSDNEKEEQKSLPDMEFCPCCSGHTGFIRSIKEKEITDEKIYRYSPKS